MITTAPMMSGKAKKTSATRMIRVSQTLPMYPEMEPRITPMTRARKIDASPTLTAIRVP